MEVYRMENAHHTLTHPRFDGGPVLEMYFASLDAWKKNLDAFAEGAGHMQKQGGEALSAAGNPSNASAQVQNAAEDIFGRAVEQQMELWRFFGKRWEQYLSLPADISRCRSAMEVAQLQLAFLRKMAADYSVESNQFARSLQGLAPDWTAAQPVPLTGQRETQH